MHIESKEKGDNKMAVQAMDLSRLLNAMVALPRITLLPLVEVAKH